jgi:hypothetical protein
LRSGWNDWLCRKSTPWLLEVSILACRSTELILLCVPDKAGVSAQCIAGRLLSTCRSWKQGFVCSIATTCALCTCRAACVSPCVDDTRRTRPTSSIIVALSVVAGKFAPLRVSRSLLCMNCSQIVKRKTSLHYLLGDD